MSQEAGQGKSHSTEPQLDGMSTLTLGTLVFHEGKDYLLQISTGLSVTAPFRKLDYSHLPASGTDDKGLATLVIPRPKPVGDTSAPTFRRSEAAIGFVEESEQTKFIMSKSGNRTLILSKDAQRSAHTTMIILKPRAYKQVLKCADGTDVVLTVRYIPDTSATP